MLTGNEPAMPVVEDNNVNGTIIRQMHYPGLTIREHFAAMFLQGMLANPELYNISQKAMKPEDMGDFYSKCAVEQADSLIKRLNKN